MFDTLISKLSVFDPEIQFILPKYRGFRSGDIAHSLADISKAKKYLGYSSEYTFQDGMDDYINYLYP